MTRILRRMSLEGCQKGFTISSWRHLSIAITRRYFRNGTTAHAALIGEADEGYGSDSDSEVEQPATAGKTRLESGGSHMVVSGGNSHLNRKADLVLTLKLKVKTTTWTDVTVRK
jgi:hypothetical protein